MKIFRLFSILFLLAATVVSCVQGDDFDTPAINFDEPDVNVNFDIASLKSLYGGFDPVLIEAGADSSTPLYIEGYVISSDETGNFYKTLVIQDKPENPEHGISISTEATDTYTFFEPGRKVYVRVDGLYSGEYAGLPTIGLQGDGGDGEVDRISIDDFNERVIRSSEVVDLVPNVMTIEQIGEDDLNTLVQLQDVQFADTEIGNAYGDPNSTFSYNRTVTNCAGDASTIIRNSGFSDFKNMPLPEGNGTLTAIVSTFNGTQQLFIRNTDDVMFDGARCEALFSEDFESIATTGNGANIALPGWTNVNVNGGSELFEARGFNNNQYAQVSAFGTGENPVEAWLVTPGIDLGSASGSTVSFSFSTIDAFNNGEALKVFISTDFSGDVETATWTELDATIATGTSSGYASSFTPSGSIDISSYAGETVFFGFQYLGGTITTTYQIDNVKVNVN